MTNPTLRLAALLCGLAAWPVQAQDARASASEASPASANLRQCVALEIEQQDYKKRMTDADTALDAARAEARAYGDQVDRQRRNLDVTNAEAVRAYNAMLDRDDALVEAQNARNDEFNALVDQHNEVVDRYNDTCAGLTVSPEERFAERQRQLKARGGGPG